MNFKKGLLMSMVLMLAFAVGTFYSSRTLVVVDTQTLWQFESQRLAKQSSIPRVYQERVMIEKHLKEQIADFSHKNKVIVLTKDALWGGDLPDYTDLILEQLSEVDDVYQD